MNIMLSMYDYEGCLLRHLAASCFLCFLQTRLVTTNINCNGNYQICILWNQELH